MAELKIAADSDTPIVPMSPMDLPQTAPKPPTLGALSSRERQCLELLARGQSNANIAEDLDIRPPTVALHLANARRKLGALTREHAVAIAITRGIFSL